MSERLAAVRRLVRSVDGLAVDIKTAHLHHGLPAIVADNLFTKIYELREELMFLLDMLHEQPERPVLVENDLARKKRGRRFPAN